MYSLITESGKHIITVCGLSEAIDCAREYRAIFPGVAILVVPA